MAKRRWIMCADTVALWENAGFKVGFGASGSNVVGFDQSPVQVVLTAAGNPTSAAQKGVHGLTGWAWSGLKSDCGNLAGIPTSNIVNVEEDEERRKESVKHPNGIVGIDHLVLKTTNIHFVNCL